MQIGMTFIELLIFLFLCVVVGFLGRLFSHRWGWLAGAIPVCLVLLVMLFAEVRALFMALRSAVSRRSGK
jgi:hypothetical protein